MNAWLIRTLFAASLCLGGCSLLPSRTDDLTLWRVESVPAAARGARVDWQLAIEEPMAAEPIAGTLIALTPGGGEYGALRGGRWHEPAPRMLQSLLLQSLDESGRIVGVSRGNDGIRADYRLLLELRAFHLERGNTDRVRMQLVARLIDWPGGRVIATQQFAAQQQIEASGIAGAVAAFQRACAEVVPAVADWALASGDADRRPK